MNTHNRHTIDWILRLLRWFCPNPLYESIEGDLLEIYEDDLKIYPPKRSKRRMLWNTLRFIHPYIILRNKFNFRFMNFALLAHHTKISYRNLVKGKLYSVINIFGLALGFSACMLLWAYTSSESNYDQHHPDGSRLYRVNQTNIWEPDGGLMGSTSPPLAATMEREFPEVEEATRINTPGSKVIRFKKSEHEIITYYEDQILAADSNFFSFFDFQLLEGNPKQSLNGTAKVVISEEIARKYFGTESAIGNILEMGDEHIPLEVTGVTKKQAPNMHFHFDFLLSMPTNPNVKNFDWSWIWSQMVTYLKLKPNANIQSLETKMDGLVETHIKSTFDRIGMNYEEFVNNKGGWHFNLQPVKDIHLRSVGIGNRIGPINDLTIIRLLRVLAFIILFLAIVNFINLSTARAATRSKEIGVKKTLGAMKITLTSQFLTESICICILSMALAIALLGGMQKIVFSLTDVNIPLNILYEKSNILYLIAAPFVVGIIAGLYPAIFLSGFKPIHVLKGKLNGGRQKTFLRNSLVAAQFAISIALMSGSVLIFQQIKFLNNQHLGFNTENILVLNHVEKLNQQVESYRDEVAKFPGVIMASTAMDIPGRGRWEDIFMREGSEIKLPISQIKIDENYFPTFDLKLKSGRRFEKDKISDKHSVIINETTARLFDWSAEEALGKRIIYPGYTHPIHIIGVAEDFHFQSLHNPITPLIFFNILSDMWGDQRSMVIKYETQNTQNLLSLLETSWTNRVESAPFEYSFLDEELSLLYEQEQQLGGLILIFTGLSIFIAIIGLFGIVSFSTEQRKKEIGIRKVMGASGFQVYYLMNIPFLKLLLVALIISIPLSWGFMNDWLNSFAYSTHISPIIFILAGLIIIVLSFLSVAYITIKAVTVNPADVLQYE